MDTTAVVIILAGFLIAITIHEFSHALAAYSLGDTTAQQAGRLTLNPIRHLDPFGTIMLLLITFTGLPGIGWGKPVPVNGRALRYGRRGMAIVSAAGPLSNLIVAFLSALAFGLLVTRGGLTTDSNGVTAARFAQFLFQINIGLCAFNLIPLPPLDGYGVAVGVLPEQLAYGLARLARYGPGILLLLVLSGSVIHISLLSLVLTPVIHFLSAWVQRLALLLVRL